MRKSPGTQHSDTRLAKCDVDTVLEVGVDWITAVCKSPEGQEALQNLGAELMCLWHDSGNETRPWSMKGYEGFICGSVQLGSRNDSSILRVTGAEADMQWSRVWAIAESITRVDFQVTCRPRIDPDKLVAKVRRQSLKWSNARQAVPLVEWHGDNRGGATVYVGSRYSDKFGRCYKKGAESPGEEYRDTVRFEVQYQRKICNPLLLSLTKSQVRLPAIASHVCGFFRGRGVNLLLPSITGTQISVTRDPPALERQLTWLRDQVSPTVRRLIDSGCYSQVIAALGLES